jgi:hypothetical protein
VTEEPQDRKPDEVRSAEQQAEFDQRMKRLYATMIPPPLQVEWARETFGGIEHPLCHTCKHYHENGWCDAFQAHAPYEIVITGEIDHRKPVAGDHGIVYESSG